MNIMGSISTDASVTTKDLMRVLQVSQQLSSNLDLDELLNELMDACIEVTGAERGFVMLYEDDKLVVKVARHMDQKTIDSTAFQISRSIIAEVENTQQPVVTTDARSDARFESSESIVTYNLRSIICVPLAAKGKPLGIVYIDNRMLKGQFTEEDLELVNAIAAQAAISIENARLHDTIVDQERMAAIGKVSSTIIHDLKSPMTVIKGYAHILASGRGTPEQIQMWGKIISRVVDSLTDMTREILEYARGEAGAELAPCELKDLIEEAVYLLKPSFADKDIEMETHIHYDGYVSVDRAKMRRALLNIATNAKEAMLQGGKLTINAAADDETVTISIQDTGGGIPPKLRDRVFEPFVSHGKEYGTGLGLAIVKKIVEEEHHGRVWLESEQGVGTTVFVQLPLPFKAAVMEPVDAG